MREGTRPFATKHPKWEVWYVNESGNRIRVMNNRGDSLVYSTDSQTGTEKDNKALLHMAEQHARRAKAEREWMNMSDDEKRNAAEMKELHWGASEWGQNF